MDLNKLKIKLDDRKKKAFYASDFGKPLLDLYFAYKNIPKTNPPAWYDTLKWGAGNGVEEAMLKVLKDSGRVNVDYDQKKHGRIEINRNGIQINGYVDAITKEGIPIEIKSINNKNRFDIERYENNEPRKNYVGQLCIYMDALGVDTGYLFVSSVDGLHRFLFKCVNYKDRKYRCGEILIDLDKEYKKWYELFDRHIVPETVPDLFDYYYKLPLKDIDWKTLSKSAITQARNNRKVIGDWEIAYSPWKDKIVKLQGAELGYNKEELDFIKEKTKGFTTW